MVQVSGWMLRTASATYRIFEVVASGAFGSVYFGRNLTNNTAVAVKLLHAHHARNPQIVERFEREAGLVRGLSHPNIVRVLDQGRSDDGIPSS